MKTIRKFYDTDGNEVAPENAVRCHELEIDDAGVVTKDSVYDVKKPA